MKRRTVLATAAAVTGGFAGCTSLERVTVGGDGVTNASSPATQTPLMTSPLVHGTITFESRRPELTGVTVYVRLEDVSRADASAEIVSERVIRNPAERATAEGIPFALPGSQADIDSRRRYSVAVHVDVDGSGDVSAGDYVSTDVNFVLTHGHPDHVTVSVQRVE